jgi:hypothetical protein|tara:strand:+ start:132 stop:443 length:312 start_codon:yes stop_codon:yes gene_type:complete
MIKLKNILKESYVWERKFGEPLPKLILDTVLSEQTPAEMKRFKKKISKLKDLEGKFRNAMYDASEILRNSTDTVKVARELESEYKKNITVFMRSLMRIEKRVR